MNVVSNFNKDVAADFVTVNEFKTESAKDFKKDVSKLLHQGIVPIVIDSYGGETHALLSMYSTIDSNPDTIFPTLALGKAMSCGAILLSMGTKGYRFADPNATIMYHNVWSAGFGNMFNIQIKADLLKDLSNRLYGIIEKNSGKPKGWFYKMFKENNQADWYLTPKQAKQHGLIDHVKVPTLTQQVTYGLNF